MSPSDWPSDTYLLAGLPSRCYICRKTRRPAHDFGNEDAHARLAASGHANVRSKPIELTLITVSDYLWVLSHTVLQMIGQLALLGALALGGVAALDPATCLDATAQATITYSASNPCYRGRVRNNAPQFTESTIYAMPTHATSWHSSSSIPTVRSSEPLLRSRTRSPQVPSAETTTR